MSRAVRDTLKEAQAIVRMVAERSDDAEDAERRTLGGAVTLISFVLLLTEKDDI